MNDNNFSCDGSHCESQNSEVRILPLNWNSNGVVCHACYNHEMEYRKEMNKRLGVEFQWLIPAWDSLQIYKGE